MTSYEFMLMGRALNQKFDKEANKEAIKMLDAAIEADKTNPLPYSWKACTIGQAMFLGFRDQDEKTMSEFLGALSKANEMNIVTIKSQIMVIKVFLDLILFLYSQINNSINEKREIIY